MTQPKSLPARPSQESLRKQAKKLFHDIAGGSTEALARVRAQLPDVELPLSQRDAQLVLAREYGFAGWQDLSAEVLKRLGKGVEWAADQAERAIHDNDLERLKQLLAEYPALLSWGLEWGGLVGRAVHSYGDSFDPERERMFTRPECAELLMDAGAVVAPSLAENILFSRARGLLQIFSRRGLLPRTLKFQAAMEELVGVTESQPDVVNEAFMTACAFRRASNASLLLERAIELSPELGGQIDEWGSRRAFVQYLCEHGVQAPPASPWRAFVEHRAMRAIIDDDLAEFTRLLSAEPWLLGESVKLIGSCVLNDRPQFIEQIYRLDPGLVERGPPPTPRSSSPLDWAFIYAKPHLVPLLTRVWPLPEDLPHAAGVGDLEKVKKWFDASGAPALGDPSHHLPVHKRIGTELHWTPPTVQRVLDTAFAWAVMNNHFKVADFLLQHGADINTRWSSHEPASILHELVFKENYEAMQFLIERGIDMTITDYRWGGTAQGWAWHAARNEKMTHWLEEAERKRGSV